MDAPSFSHLRVHSFFSFFEATASPEALAEKAAVEEMSVLALTDTALFGAVKFTRACIDAGLLPILGLTLYMQPFSPNGEIDVASHSKAVLYAQNPTGYRSLCFLSTEIMKRQWQSPTAPSMLDWNTLTARSEGLHFLEAGLESRLASMITSGELKQARQYLSQLAGLFEDRCSVGLEMASSDRIPIIEEMVAEADRFGVPILAAQPVVCLEEQECELLPVLEAISRNEQLEKVTAEWGSTGSVGEKKPVWRSQEEVEQMFREWPAAIRNIPDFVRQFQPSLEKERSTYFSSTAGSRASSNEKLARTAETGFQDRYSQSQDPEIMDRLKYELDAITSRGYASIFLHVSEITEFARVNDIAMNTRGSVANSLVAYCIGITDIDPIEHELIFERFLNPARQDLPDIDLDFCSRRREQVIDHLRGQYGIERIAQVATVNTFRIRSAVREVAKAFGYSQAQIKRLTTGLPHHWYSSRRGAAAKSTEEVIQSFSDPTDHEVLQMAHRLIGLPNHISQHPGGVVISDDEIVERLPLHFTPAGQLAAQYDQEDLAWLGEPKIDLLGIRSLSVFSEAVEWVHQHHPQEGHPLDIPNSDERTSELIARGETVGVFQCDSAGARRTLRQLKAKTIRDMAVANAFFKPGPATGGMAGSFIRRYRGEESVDYLHPSLEPILSSTKGVLIFQEQIIRVVREIAGLSWEDADRIRRGMSHFRTEEMAEVRDRFLSGCEQPPPGGPGLDKTQAMRLWDQVEAFSGYGFNKGHATAYANLSYKMAYLKAHWPECLFCARLSAGGGYYPTAVYIAEARRLGVEVQPPHINYSTRLPTLTYERRSDGIRQPRIWLGLDRIKDLSRRSIHEIIRERTRRPFSGWMDFASRVSLRRGEFENLVRSGALDGMIESRTQALHAAGGGGASQQLLQHQFDFMSSDENADDQPQMLFEWEKELLGFPVSIDPLELTSVPYPWQTPLERLSQTKGELISTVGYRLPGWMWRDEFLLANRDTWVDARMVSSKQPGGTAMRSWVPVKLTGRWSEDEWGGGWLEPEIIEPLHWLG